MRIEREHAAAVVIDYQEKLIPAMDRKETLIENSSILLAGLRALGIPMVFTQQYTKGLGSTVRELTQAAGTEEFVEKIRFSAWQDVVSSHPWIQGKKYIILCAVAPHTSVRHTLIHRRPPAFVPVLVTDCVSSRKRTDYETALIRARQEGAILTTYEALLFELLEKAGTEESKKIQRLVK